MDQPGLDADLHRTALAALGRINRISRTDAAIWRPLCRLARESSRPIRVLDLACGGGDVLRSLAQRARRANVSVEWSGCDISELAVGYARQLAEQGGFSELAFFERNLI